MQQLGGPAPDTSEALREAVCGAAKKLAGWRDGDTAEKALELLTQQCPAELRRLLKEVGKFGDKVIQSELDALTQRVEVLEKEMVVVKSDMTEVKSDMTVVKSEVRHTSYSLQTERQYCRAPTAESALSYINC